MVFFMSIRLSSPYQTFYDYFEAAPISFNHVFICQWHNTKIVICKTCERSTS